MCWIVANIRWILVVCGALTCTMLFAAVAPQAALRATFGEALEGPVAEIVVRNWGGLIALGGAMLIYAAYHPSARPLVLAYAGLGKLFFIGLVLAQSGPYARHAGVVLMTDLVMVALFAAYLIAARRPADRPAGGYTSRQA
jgi:hypothetical protein